MLVFYHQYQSCELKRERLKKLLFRYRKLPLHKGWRTEGAFEKPIVGNWLY